MSDLVPKCIAEFTGTFMLVLSVGANVLAGNPTWAVTSIACTLMVSIYALGGVSGAHLNPAVTLAIYAADWEKKKDNLKEGLAYMGSQIAGGLVAAFVNVVLLFDAANLSPGKGVSWWQAAMAEIIYTFMLCFVVLNVACSSRHAGKNQFYGLAIGFVVIAGGYGAGHLSGGAFNPAVAIGVDTGSVKSGFGWCLAYTVFECIGALIAAALFKVVRPEDSAAATDVSQGYPPLSKYMSEFLGTYILVLTVGLNVLGGSAAPVWSIAASLMCMIFALGTVSGGHFNPAVTAAVVIGKRPGAPEAKEAAAYVGVQLVAGLAGALTYMLMEGGQTIPLAPGKGYVWYQAYIAEFFFTFLLAFVVLCVATVAPEKQLSEYFAFAIGSCVTAGGCAIGAVSGGSLNPAVSFGLGVTGATGAMSAAHIAAYMAVEIAAGGAAAVLFKVTHPEEYAEGEPLKP